jgi:hypothetical protein
MHPLDDGLRYAQCCVRSLSSPQTGIAQKQHARFVLEHAADSVLAQIPHRSHLGDGVVVLPELKVRIRATPRYFCRVLVT